MPDPHLIVCADDYGLTPGICEGILRSQAHGIVTSTSVLVTGRAFEWGATRLRDSGLEAGLHLAIVGEDPPLLSAREIPSIVDRRGNLAASWRSLAAQWSIGAIDSGDVAREADAQVEAARAAGLDIAHINAHQHVHLWPALSRLVVDLANANRIDAIRVPRSRAGTPRTLAINHLARALASRARESGLSTPDWFAGLDEAGAMGSHELGRVVRAVARDRPSWAEVNVHPGSERDPDRARYKWGYQWGSEQRALCDDRLAEMIRTLGLRLGTFAELVRSQPRTAGDAA